ncbi:hypothetical protein [Cupriavidus plantarum]|uniref:hypothetical protein n=1 Tax=Cupriavidus plantarum TaxID=942865 RepID=UPI00339D5081
MVNNIPNASDYFDSGNEVFNFAWNTVAHLLCAFDEAGYYGYEPAEISEAFWSAANRELSTAITIVQQGVELFLKGRIAEVSPFLLIASDSPSRWPSPYDGKSIEFSQFRTIDAQDLVRVHDIFAASKLPETFTAKFDELRELRNTIIHSTGKNVTVRAIEVVDALLFMHRALFADENWMTTRREFLRRSPQSELGSGEYATNEACHEAEIVVAQLQPAQVQAYFRIDKRQRLYICPACLDDANTDAGFDHKLAVLRPKAPGATKLYCPVCNDEHEVSRVKCEQDECLGNVLNDEGRCLTCGCWNG